MRHWRHVRRGRLVLRHARILGGRRGQCPLHFLRLRGGDTDAQGLRRLALTLEQAECGRRDLQCIVVVQQRLECCEFACAHAISEDLAKLAHACAIATHGMRHRVRQHEVDERAARQQRAQVRNLSRGDQRNDLHRRSAQCGIECSAGGRHIVQYPQHAVRVDRATGGLHFAARSVVAQCAQGGLCLGDLRGLWRDDDRGRCVDRVQHATQRGRARSGADQHVLHVDRRTAFTHHVVTHTTRALHERLGEGRHGIRLGGHGDGACDVLRQLGHDGRDRRLVAQRQRQVGLQHEHLRDGLELEQATGQQCRDV